ncbi:MAG: FAD-dependent oxidoreductase [Candidatus Thermoplasmatota archaeon]|nr:FAD-dependent oxidoreductase [Candidatus Thermoplasmatota archaeon]
MSEEKHREIVIVGLGASGLYSSKAALNQDRSCHVTIIEKRSFDQFSPCGLPFVIEGLVDSFEELKHVVPEIKGKLDKLLGHDVISVDPVGKTVTAVELSTGNKKLIPYDSLILSNGATPMNLPIPGAKEFNGKGLHFVSDIEDSSRLLEAARGSPLKRSVVVGGGAIGLEVAMGLLKLGHEVVMTKRTEPPLPRNLDPVMGRLIVEKLESMGVRVLFGKGIDSINGTDRVEFVTIAGETIPCDIVVMAVGMRANTQLAEMAGCKVSGGLVVVNNMMETKVPGIYATGDLVGTYSRLDRTPATMQLATSAFRQGMAAGTNAAGGSTSYPGALNTFLTVIDDMEIAATGYNLETAQKLGYDATAISTRGDIKPHYMPECSTINLRVVVETGSGRILGAQAIGAKGAAWRINLFALAIHGGMTLHDLLDTELSYNPPVSQMYDPITQLAEIGMKRLKLPPKECTRVFFPKDE